MTRYRLTPPRRLGPNPTEQADFEEKLAKLPDAPGRAKPPAKPAPPPAVSTTATPTLPGFEQLAAKLPVAAKDWRSEKPAFFTPLKTTLRKTQKRLKAAQPRKLGAANMRVIETATEIMASPTGFPISYQHSVLCQTSMPYRNPGKDVHRWEKTNGAASLLLTAGEARHPSGKWVQIGLPFGPKPRQILAYLNTQAILQQKPLIDIEASLAGFVAAMGFDKHGRNFASVKDQVARLAAADFRLGYSTDTDSATTHKGTIVASFNLWCEKDDRQRVLWPRTIALDDRYFTSLVEHAVPLDTRAIAALGHSAMALDIYAWLAQRLHRVHPTAPVTIGWAALQNQFGDGFTRIRDFRRKFLIALRAAKAVYPAARLGVDGHGLVLENSPPPVAKRLVQAAQIAAPKDRA